MKSISKTKILILKNSFWLFLAFSFTSLYLVFLNSLPFSLSCVFK
ncbi:hypothetical protein C414_000390042 [Campylobacter jejuni subsp. jejuni 414]|nr:hypothetical protein C414_000390042 [Campylobacter jejuni subsp. jejuni 414]